MKKPIKTVFFVCLLSILASIIVISTSCHSDKCNTITCVNKSYCQGGTCICPVGFEGPTCNKLTSEKFCGNWMVYEKGSGSLSAQYPISIIPDSNIVTDVLISNFNNYFKVPVRAVVNGYNITIPNQQLEGKILFGKGYIYSPDNVNYNQYGAISMQYEIIDSATNAINDYGYDEKTDGSKPSVWNK